MFGILLADLFTGASETFVFGLSGGFNQSAVGDEILYPFKAGDIVDLIEDNQAEDSADTRNRPQTEIGIRVMLGISHVQHGEATDAEVHRLCVKIDTTVKFVLLGVKLI